jgi:hypothetical protein
VQFVPVSSTDGPDYFLIFHAALQNLIPDALTAAFDTEFNDFTAGVRQAAGPVLIEKAHMGVNHKGQGADFLVGLAKLFDIGKGSTFDSYSAEILFFQHVIGCNL